MRRGGRTCLSGAGGSNRRRPGHLRHFGWTRGDGPTETDSSHGSSGWRALDMPAGVDGAAKSDEAEATRHKK